MTCTTVEQTDPTTRGHATAEASRELEALQRLQAISTRLTGEGDLDALHELILDAAIAIMGSDFATVQRLDAETGALHLLAARGLQPEAEAYWRVLHTDHGSICGEALRSGTRVVADDLETTGVRVDAADRLQFRANGIRAVQSTPLLSRSGQPLGMISTHWRVPHRPAVRDLRLLDVLARQAADLIERAEAHDRLLREAERARAAERRSHALVHELAHRVKNSMAIVQAIALQTLRHADSLDRFGETFLARLAALAQTHDQLLRSHWEGVDLHELVAQEMRPYGTRGQRWSISGEGVRLDPTTALALGMALHELATNAAKYGALSQASGHVRVHWNLAPDPGGMLELRWGEEGGPTVREPARRGFGSRLLERGLAHQLHADVDLAFMSGGVRCGFRIPLRNTADEPLLPPLPA